MNDPTDYIKLVLWWPEKQTCRYLSVSGDGGLLRMDEGVRNLETEAGGYFR